MKKNKKDLKNLKFKNLQAEVEFWDQVDLGDYLETDDFDQAIFPNLKMSTRPVSIRLPEYLIALIKEQANAIGMPYQSLIKQSLYQKFLSK